MIKMNYDNLRAHISRQVGYHKKYDGVVKEKLPQKEHTCSNTTDFITKTKKGSGTIRKIINRQHPRADLHNPKKWRKKLDSPTITREQIKDNIIRLHSIYIDSNLADHLSRLRLGKTLLNAQLYHSNLKDDPHCEICKQQINEEIPEDYKHALYTCPNTKKIVDKSPS